MSDQTRDPNERDRAALSYYQNGVYDDATQAFKDGWDACERARASLPKSQGLTVRADAVVEASNEIVDSNDDIQWWRFQPFEIREAQESQPPASECADCGEVKCVCWGDADDRSQASNEAFEREAREYIGSAETDPTIETELRAATWGRDYGRREAAAELGRLSDLIYSEDGYIASQREQAAEIDMLDEIRVGHIKRIAEQAKEIEFLKSEVQAYKDFHEDVLRSKEKLIAELEAELAELKNNDSL